MENTIELPEITDSLWDRWDPVKAKATLLGGGLELNEIEELVRLREILGLDYRTFAQVN